jgi:hypothetical protein
LKIVVVRKFNKGKTLLPILPERDNTSSEHVFKKLIHSFSLSSGLRMIRCAKGNMSSHSLLKAFPEPGGEEAPTVGNNLLWNTVKSDYPRNIQLY